MQAAQCTEAGCPPSASTPAEEAITFTRLDSAMPPVLPLAFLCLLLQSGRATCCLSLMPWRFWKGGNSSRRGHAACCSCRCTLRHLGKGLSEGLAGAGARRQVAPAPHCDPAVVFNCRAATGSKYQAYSLPQALAPWQTLMLDLSRATIGCSERNHGPPVDKHLRAAFMPPDSARRAGCLPPGTLRRAACFSPHCISCGTD